MTENTLALKIRLGNVQEWLNLSENPLHCAQLASADVIKEVYYMNNKCEMITASDLSQAVNRAACWVSHAQRLAKILLAESKAPARVAVPSNGKPGLQLNCDVCNAKFWTGIGYHIGELCLSCGEGTLGDGIPF